VSWQDALRAVIRERVTVVAGYDAVARSPSRTTRLRSVIALKTYQKAGRNVTFTRFNVYLRLNIVARMMFVYFQWFTSDTCVIVEKTSVVERKFDYNLFGGQASC
jgi:5-methylcytosine-specific restriction endonuclease McrA